MTDREFINNLIKIYFSNAKEPHQATIDNAFTNRLNDIVDKVENQGQVLDIIKELISKHCKIELIDGETYYQIRIKVMGSDYTFGMSITKEEYDLLKRWTDGKSI